MRWLLALACCALPASAQHIDLASGWTLESPDHKVYPTSVPSTVVATLVANKALPDPDFGMNLRTYPGMGYRVGQMFGFVPSVEGGAPAGIGDDGADDEEG